MKASSHIGVDSVNIYGLTSKCGHSQHIRRPHPMLLPDIKTEIRKAWSDSAPLTTTAVVMLVAFVASVAGIFLDDRIITGVPAWLKPAKFAISYAVFCLNKN